MVYFPQTFYYTIEFNRIDEVIAIIELKKYFVNKFPKKYNQLHDNICSLIHSYHYKTSDSIMILYNFMEMKIPVQYIQCVFHDRLIDVVANFTHYMGKKTHSKYEYEVFHDDNSYQEYKKCFSTRLRRKMHNEDLEHISIIKMSIKDESSLNSKLNKSKNKSHKLVKLYELNDIVRSSIGLLSLSIFY